MEKVTTDAERHNCRSAEDRYLAACVGQARDGDAAAFECLYRKTIRSLFPVVQRICSVHVEDVLADTYMQAWTSLKTYERDRCTVLGWLLTIARSRARDRMRMERTRHAGMEGAISYDGDDSMHQAAGPEDQASSVQLHVRLQTAFATLLPSQRWVMGLAYYRDHTHNEISTLTGMPLGTVKTLILRSHKQLRGMMQPEASPASPSQHAIAIRP